MNKEKEVYKPARGILVLSFGLISILFLGPFTGLPAWFMGNKDLNKMNEGVLDSKERTITKVGMITGIIGTIWGIAVMLFITYGIYSGLTTIDKNIQTVNRNAVTADCMTIAALAQQYYFTTTEKGGGDSSFVNLELPLHLYKTKNGEYSFIVLADDKIEITGKGTEMGKDGIQPVKIKIFAGPSDIETEIVN